MLNNDDILLFSRALKGKVVKQVASCGALTLALTINGELYLSGSTEILKNMSLCFTKIADNISYVTCNQEQYGKFASVWYITNDGDLYGFGYNSNGQQGDGTTVNVTVPTKRASNVKDVKCSSNVSWYLTNDGDLYSCGYNSLYGQGGDSSSDVKTFTHRASDVRQFEILSDGSATVYVTNGNVLYGVGYNGYGGLGNGSYQSNAITSFKQLATNVKEIAKYGLGNDKSCAYIGTNNSLYVSGSNKYGQLGKGSTTTLYSFSSVASSVSSATFSFYTSWYINSKGELYGSGYNKDGQIGNGTTTNITTYTKMASNVKKVVIDEAMTYNGNRTYYITNDGELYGCGSNSSYQMGNGTTTDVTTFTKIASNVSDVISNDYMTWYITNDGELYGCGFWETGALASGSITPVTNFEKRQPKNRVEKTGTACVTRKYFDEDILTINGTITITTDISTVSLARGDYFYSYYIKSITGEGITFISVPVATSYTYFIVDEITDGFNFVAQNS